MNEILKTGAWALLILTFIVYISSLLNENEKAHIPEYVESGYEVFLDGEPIAAENIDFKQYNVSIDHDAKKIFCTAKTYSHSRSHSYFIPIPIPY